MLTIQKGPLYPIYKNKEKNTKACSKVLKSLLRLFSTSLGETTSVIVYNELKYAVNPLLQLE
jgi:hypothetical protein